MIHNNVTKGYRFKITLITLLEFNGVPLISEVCRPSQAGGIEAGGCYLWALRRWRLSGDLTLVRAMMELTIIFRLATGTFAAWAILRGWLIPLWAVVTVADYAIAAAQAWLLHRGALG